VFAPDDLKVDLKRIVGKHLLDLFGLHAVSRDMTDVCLFRFGAD
jgi:hypothetical protein